VASAALGGTEFGLMARLVALVAFEAALFCVDGGMDTFVWQARQLVTLTLLSCSRRGIAALALVAWGSFA